MSRSEAGMGRTLSRGVIRLGDYTSCGGRVITASARMTVDGIPIALWGDECTCPLAVPDNPELACDGDPDSSCDRICQGDPEDRYNAVVICEGEPEARCDGTPIALEGHRTNCGATLIASQRHRCNVKPLVKTQASIGQGASKASPGSG